MGLWTLVTAAPRVLAGRRAPGLHGILEGAPPHATEHDVRPPAGVPRREGVLRHLEEPTSPLMGIRTLSLEIYFLSYKLLGSRFLRPLRPTCLSHY
jgi:hypothetical protein